MIWAFLIFALGLLLSAFFSGTETGLYRVSRTRLVLDGLSGSRLAKSMVWLVNRPAVFVATTLVGNNVANYLVSFSIVIGAAAMLGDGAAGELLAPIMLSPIVFVFGELLPKNFFYHAPYRLLVTTRPLLLVATLLFLPISLLLGLLGKLLNQVTGETPFRLKLSMARGDFGQLLNAGHEAGILGSGQKSLAENIYEIGDQAAISFGVPVDRLAIVDTPFDAVNAAHRGRRKNHALVLVRQQGRIIGYLRFAELVVRESTPDIKPIIKGRTSDRHLGLLLRLYDSGSDVAVLHDERGEVRSIVTRRQLLQPLVK